MLTALTQFLTAVIATGMITFTVTHLHAPLVAWLLWFWHWILAIPIAFATVRWISPRIRAFLAKYIVD